MVVMPFEGYEKSKYVGKNLSIKKNMPSKRLGGYTFLAWIHGK